MTGYKSPPRRERTIFVPSTALNTICLGLAEKYGSGRSWDAVGREIGVPGIVVYRAVVRQRYPVSRKYRVALGLAKPRKPRAKSWKLEVTWHVCAGYGTRRIVVLPDDFPYQYDVKVVPVDSAAQTSLG